MEVATKITKLTDINNNIATRYARIMCKIDYANLAAPTAKPNQGTAMPPSRSKYQPNPTFLEQGGNKDRNKPWYTTVSDLMSESDNTIITELLHSGVRTQYTLIPLGSLNCSWRKKLVESSIQCSWTNAL